MMSALVLASCSETDENTDSEYDDWQAKNKTALPRFSSRPSRREKPTDGTSTAIGVWRTRREIRISTTSLSLLPSMSRKTTSWCR